MTWLLNINLLLENSPDTIHMKGFQLQGWLGLDKTYDLDARKLIFQTSLIVGEEGMRCGQGSSLRWSLTGREGARTVRWESFFLINCQQWMLCASKIRTGGQCLDLTLLHLDNDDKSVQDVATFTDLIQPVKPVWSQWVKMKWNESSKIICIIRKNWNSN